EAAPWIAVRDSYTHQLLDIVLNHSPESGSAESLVEFDPLIRDPTLADQKGLRRELEAGLVKLKAIESILVAQHLVTLPPRAATVRIASEAETAGQPAPHKDSQPYLHNTDERGEFVLPPNMPSAHGAAGDMNDDFNFDSFAWSLTAHEAGPGRDLQDLAMLEHGVSLARALFAFNNTNVES